MLLRSKDSVKNYHFQDEKYKEKIKRPVKSCEVYEQTRHCKIDWSLIPNLVA